MYSVELVGNVRVSLRVWVAAMPRIGEVINLPDEQIFAVVKEVTHIASFKPRKTDEVAAVIAIE